MYVDSQKTINFRVLIRIKTFNNKKYDYYIGVHQVSQRGWV